VEKEEEGRRKALDEAAATASTARRRRGRRGERRLREGLDRDAAACCLLVPIAAGMTSALCLPVEGVFMVVLSEN